METKTNQNTPTRILSIEEMAAELGLSTEKLQEIRQTLDNVKLVGEAVVEKDEELINDNPSCLMLSETGIKEVNEFLESCDYGVMEFTLDSMKPALSEMKYVDYVAKVTTEDLSEIIHSMPRLLIQQNLVHMCFLNMRYPTDTFEKNISLMVDAYSNFSDIERENNFPLINEVLKMNSKWNAIFYEAIHEKSFKIKHFILPKSFQMYMMEYNKALLFFMYQAG